MNTIEEKLTKFTELEIEKILYNLNMSVRQIKKSYISCTGYFASYKNKSQIAFESVLERDFYMLLEFDKNVIKYEEQPLSIQYKYLDGNTRKYTPDTLVTYKDKSKCLFEVKYKDELINNIELTKKIELIKEELSNNYKFDFKVFTDLDMNNIYLNNLKFLYKFAFIEDGEDYLEKINNILNNIDEITVKEILKKLEVDKYKQLEVIPYLWLYIFRNTNVINLYQKLTMNSTLEKRI